MPCMTTWLALRLVKFTALAVLGVGTGVAVSAANQADRARAAFWWATPALFVAWLAGYGLLHTTERSMVDPFVGIGVFGSLIGLHGAVLCASLPSPRRVSQWLGLAGLAVASAGMVTRSAEAWVTGAGIVAALVGTAVVLPLLPTLEGDGEYDLSSQAVPWFAWLARLEGLSLIALFIGMPLKRMDIFIDGGTGALGWVHGSLFLLYLQALQVAARAEGWSMARAGAGAIAAFLPFGTFAFEAWTRRQADADRNPRTT